MKLNKRIKSILIFVLLLLACPLAGQAGQMLVLHVYYGGWVYQDLGSVQQWQKVFANSANQYIGSLDPEDDFYGLETKLNVGSDLDNWSNAGVDYWGYGKSGAITPGIFVVCDQQASCAAEFDLPLVYCNIATPSPYKGLGQAWVLHGNTNAEYDSVAGPVETMACQPGFPWDEEPPGTDCPSEAQGQFSVVEIDLATGEVVSIHREARLGGNAMRRPEGSFVFADWALESTDSNVGALISSRDLRSSQRAEKQIRDWRSRPNQLKFRLSAPVHPMNHLAIPLPVAKLAPFEKPSSLRIPKLREEVPRSAERIAVEGDSDLMLVRAEFNKNAEIDVFQILYENDPLDFEMVEEIRSRLVLEYETEKRHRAVAYLLAKDSGKGPAITWSQVVLPMCCCNEEYCYPGEGEL